MMKFKAVTMALAFVLAAAPQYAFAAQAAQGDDSSEIYPTDFIEDLADTLGSTLSDYALNGQTSAFAGDTSLYVISPDDNGDMQLERKNGVTAPQAITMLDYGEDGTLYFYAPPSVYRYAPETKSGYAPADYEFETNTEIDVNGYRYVLNSTSGGLMAYNIQQPDPQYLFEDGCSQLKEYNGEAYIINDGAVYMLDGLTTAKVPTTYIDTSTDDKIRTGNAAEALAGDYTVRPVTVRTRTTDGHNTFITKIDLDEIGQYFTVPDETKILPDGEEQKVPSTQRLMNDSNALAIAEVGNATIIVMPDENGLSQSYITLTTATEQTSYSPPANDMSHAYALTDISIYSRPYICGATRIADVATGTLFTVEEKFSLSYLDDVFYRVTYTAEDGREITGYVAAGLLSAYTFEGEGEKENTTGQDDFEYGDNVEKVIIVLLIILLALVAVGYVIFYLTRKGEGSVRRRKNAPSDENDDLYS